MLCRLAKLAGRSARLVVLLDGLRADGLLLLGGLQRVAVPGAVGRRVPVRATRSVGQRRNAWRRCAARPAAPDRVDGAARCCSTSTGLVRTASPIRCLRSAAARATGCEATPVARAGRRWACACTWRTWRSPAGTRSRRFTPRQSGSRHFAGPYGGVWDGAKAAFEGLRQLLSFQRHHVYLPQAGGSPFIDAGHNLLLFAFLLAAIPAWSACCDCCRSPTACMCWRRSRCRSPTRWPPNH